MTGNQSKEKTGAEERLDPAECRERLRFETLLVDLSARFIHLPAEQVDDAIVDAQRRICECIGLDVVVLWQWEVDAPGVFTLTHHYRRREGPPLTRQLQATELFPWGLREVQAGRSFLFSSLDDVPQGAERDQESYRYFGVRNAFLLPLAVGGGAPFGAISFHDMVAPRVWSDALIQRLELVARIFANALARMQHELTMRESEERLALALEAAAAGVWSMDFQSNMVWASAEERELFGFPANEHLTYDSFLRVIHPDDRNSVRTAVEKAMRTNTPLFVEYRITQPEGSVRWISAQGRPQCRGKAKPDRLMGVSTDITARKQAEESLARANRQSQLILAAAAEGILGLDLAGNHVFVNPAAAEMLGYAPEELAGQSGHGIWHHSRADGAAYPEDECPICAVCRQGAEHHVVDEVFWRKDGTCFPVDYKCTPILEGGRRVGAVITFEDVTGRRETEKALRESQARMAAAMDVAELGFYEVENGDRVAFLDHRAREIIGASPADEETDRIFEFWGAHVHPEDLPRVMELNRALNEGERERLTLDYRFLNPERGVIHVHHLVHVIERDAAGRAVRTIGVLQDVTGRRETEQALRESRARMAAALDVAELGFYEMINNVRVTFLDRRAREIIGATEADEQAGRILEFWTEHLHPEDFPGVMEVRRLMEEAGRDRTTVDYRFLNPARGVIHIHHLVHVLERDAAGLAVRTIGVLQDVTERKAAELEVRRTQNELAHATRMSVLGELAASMAHELNQPLAAILSNAQAARRFLAAPDPDMQEIREILDDIVRDDKRAGDVIHHMRAMVKKKGEVEAEPLDFNKLVGNTAKLVHSEMVGRNVGLKLDLAPRLPAILAGRVEMQQVLLNLMVNAMDAMRDQPAERRLLRIRTSAADGWVRAALHDHGPGIPEHAMADIFRPFFTTKTQGLGMGLSISRSMVEAHSGKLWAENAADGGAIFWIEMPVGEEEEEKGARGAAEGRGEEPRREGRGARETAEERGTRGEGENSRGEGA